MRKAAVQKLYATLMLLLAYGYLVGLVVWGVLHIWAGDRWWWLFLLNSLGGYLFVPLVAVALVALVTRHWPLCFPLLGALVIWGFLFGDVLMPPLRPRTDGPSPSLTMMTYNTMKSTACARQVTATIQDSAPDVVFLQELGQETAETIWSDLADHYPYQVFDLHRRSGMGVISRYPIRPVSTGGGLPGAWLGQPQVLRLDLGTVPVTILNIHMISILGGQGPSPTAIEQATREREQQAEMLRGLAMDHPSPLIIAGDFNATPLNRSYAILASELQDAWREGGRGTGHTYPVITFPFPGQRSACGRAPLVGLPCLFRIDHVFHSHHWQTLAAWVAPQDGVSDHRPVVVRLLLKERTNEGHSSAAESSTWSRTRSNWR